MSALRSTGIASPPMLAIQKKTTEQCINCKLQLKYAQSVPTSIASASPRLPATGHKAAEQYEWVLIRLLALPPRPCWRFSKRQQSNVANTALEKFLGAQEQPVFSAQHGAQCIKPQGARGPHMSYTKNTISCAGNPFTPERIKCNMYNDWQSFPHSLKLN